MNFESDIPWHIVGAGYISTIRVLGDYVKNRSVECFDALLSWP